MPQDEGGMIAACNAASESGRPGSNWRPCAWQSPRHPRRRLSRWTASPTSWARSSGCASG